MGPRYSIANKILAAQGVPAGTSEPPYIPAGIEPPGADPLAELQGQTINTIPNPNAWGQPTIEPPQALIVRPGWGEPAPSAPPSADLPAWMAGPQGGPDELPAGIPAVVWDALQARQAREARQAQAISPINELTAAGPMTSAPLRALAAMPAVAQGAPPLPGSELPPLQPSGVPTGQPGAPGAQPPSSGGVSISGAGPAAPGELDKSIKTLQDITAAEQAAAKAAPGTVEGLFKTAAEAEEQATQVAKQKAYDEGVRRQAADALLQAEEAKQTAFVEKFHADYNAKLEQYQTAIDKYANAEIDPNRVWKSMGVGGQLGSLFAALLSSTGQALTSRHGGQAGPNLALVTLDQTIERDLRAQQMEIQRAGQAANFQGNMLSQLQAKFGNEQQAYNAAKAILIARFQRGLDAIGDKYAGPEMTAKLAVTKAGLEARKQGVIQDLQKAAYQEARVNATASGQLAATKTQLAISSRDQALREREQALRERMAAEKASETPAPIFSTDAAGRPVEAWQPIRQVGEKERKEAATLSQQYRSLDDDLSSILQTAQRAGPTDYMGLPSDERQALDRAWASARANLLAIRGYKRISETTMKLAGEMLGKDPSNLFSSTQEIVPLIRKKLRGELNAGMANLGYANPLQATPRGNIPGAQ
jgi:hypothetical protein